MNELRFRQVHLDFHTSPLIKNIGKGFDSKEFAKTLKEAHVDSITCFARCHHGMLYYDSKLNPERIHPELVNKQLLQEQIKACHEVGIRVPIYTTVQWDYYTAHEHPEWVSRNHEGKANGEGAGNIQLPYEAGFYDILCLNSPYREFLKAHVTEILEVFNPADGIFLDIVFPMECSCEYCRRMMTEQGLKPHKTEDRKQFAIETIKNFKLEMSELIREYNPEASIFYNRGHVGILEKDCEEAYTHFELETLPSGGWGYLHFPATIRYARNLGKECLGQTGKFHTLWGDFHSLKNQAALEFECFNMLAQNAKCMVGDQLDPNGRLAPEVYELIGAVYEQVEAKEPWCRGASALVDIGVVTPEEFMGAEAGMLPPALRGAVRILQESAMQFDVIDTKTPLEKYKLILLPDLIEVSDTFASKLEAYIAKGGKVLASFKSGLNEAGTAFNLEALGVTLKEEQPVDLEGNPVAGVRFSRGNYADYIVPQGKLAEGLKEVPYVMYTKGLEVACCGNGKGLAPVMQSVFDRTYEHFCSHRHSPCSEEYAYDGVIGTDSTIYFAHPMFGQYNQNAPLWCKKLVVNAIRSLIDPIVNHQGPSTMLVTVNEQKAREAMIVHLLHYIPERRGMDLDVIEDVIPLYNVPLDIAVNKEVKCVTLQPQGKEIAFRIANNRVYIEVPEIRGHQIIEIL